MADKGLIYISLHVSLMLVSLNVSLISLHRLNCILDHCSYVHGLALLLLC